MMMDPHENPSANPTPCAPTTPAQPEPIVLVPVPKVGVRIAKLSEVIEEMRTRAIPPFGVRRNRA